MRGKLISGLLVLALMSLSLISAKRVERWTIDVDSHEPLPANSDENPCDFDIVWGFEGSSFSIGWYDEEGQLIRLYDVSNKIEETFSANGKSLELQGIAVHYTLLPDGNLLISYLGPSGFGIIPGYGPVWGGAGNGSTIYKYDPAIDDWIEIESIREAGIRKYDDFSPVCEFLSP